MLNCMQCGEPVESLKSDPDRPDTTLYGCPKCDILWEERGSRIQRGNISLSEWKEERKKQEEKEQEQKKWIREATSEPMI